MLENIKSIFTISLSLFILMNAFGNTSLFLNLLKRISRQRQKQIVLRELLIALGLIILFDFIGSALLNFLNITQDIVGIAGGIVLFLLSLRMLFPPPEKEKTQTEAEFKKITEPFIVPLAIPLVAGPAVLAAVMLYSQQVNTPIILTSIVIAWAATLGILLLSAHLSDWLGERGLLAIERLMGFIMVMIAIQMFLTGIKNFMNI